MIPRFKINNLLKSRISVKTSIIKPIKHKIITNKKLNQLQIKSSKKSLCQVRYLA
jgi:hypothetical protein